MAYAIAGIDVHKRMLAVVVADLAATREDAFERRQFGSTPAQLRRLADWLSEHQVDEVVMESTAQYWKPVWAALERHWTPRPARPGPAVAGPCTWRTRDRTRAAGAQARLHGRRTAGEAAGRPGVDPELRARARAAPVADGDAHEGPTNAQPGPAPEPAGGAAGTSPPQALEPGLGPPRRERPADARGAGRRGHRPRGAAGPGRSSLAGHARSSCATPSRPAKSSVPSTDAS